MIVDLNKARTDPFTTKQYDVCICGAGIAGIVLALKLSKHLQILLLEGGGFEATADSQDNYRGEVVGQDYSELTAGRLRYFGGTSNHWAGECRPLDEHDFEPKSYVPLSGWPIQHSDLNPYLKEAEKILDLPDDESWNEPDGYFERKLNTTADFHSIKYKFSPPTRFGEKYRNEIERRKNIACFLNANVTRLELGTDLLGIQRAIIHTYSGHIFNARARRFILATGGIENSRILLNSNREIPPGLGNTANLVGKFFSDHLYTEVGAFILDHRSNENIEQFPFGDSLRGRLRKQICTSEWAQDTAALIRGKSPDCLSELRHFFSPSPEYMKRDRTLNFSLRMRTRTPGHRQKMDGRLFIASEQSINPLSRLSLGPELDRFGMRRIRLDWRLSDIDMHTLQRAIIRFGEIFAELNLGRVRVSEWLRENKPEYSGGHGSHHMCSTRMAASAEKGVVDSNHKVFGVNNLYIAGSSVFSTAGQANPTLTIVQMTLRLADHINTHLVK